MPTPGDVDVVLAAEFMEAGRSILRGLVTPERTTLITSTHRSFAVAEKMAPGNGIADSSAVTAAIGVTAKKEIVFNMDALAVQNRSVISAAMFGALAGSGTLPFETSGYLDVIRSGGKGVEPSIRTFEAASERAATGAERPVLPAPHTSGQPEIAPDALFAPLVDRLRRELPASASAMTFAGLRKVVDYQDLHYGREYLDILKRLYGLDQQCGGAGRDHQFTTTAAKYLANAMTYDEMNSELPTSRPARAAARGLPRSWVCATASSSKLPSSCTRAWRRWPARFLSASPVGSRHGPACSNGSTAASTRGGGCGLIRWPGF